jgi:hypothetical protein
MLGYFRKIFKLRRRKKTGISRELYRLIRMNKQVLPLQK